MYRILITDGLEQKALEALQAEADVTVLKGLSPVELLHEIDGYDALIVRSSTRVTEDVLRSGRSLRVVGRAGSGLDNIDTEAARRLGITIINVPGANAVAAAELTMALMLAVARHLPDASSCLEQGGWRSEAHTGFELYGKTLGIIGLGRIGREVALRASAFGMSILACDPYLSNEAHAKARVRLADLYSLLKASDIVTVHVPLNQETRGLIGRAQLNLMKKGAILVNCARGGIVDEKALYRALMDGQIAGAALDVFEREPPGEHPLFEMKNVIATPHLGAATREARRRCSEAISLATLRALKGEPLEADTHWGVGVHGLRAAGLGSQKYTERSV